MAELVSIIASSCPALCRASTSCFPQSKKDVDGIGTRACPSSALLSAAGRVYPTFGDKPGRDDVDKSRSRTTPRINHAIAVAAAVFVLGSPAAAQDPVADFYKGKQVRFIIGAITGGGNDSYARLVARHLGKHIPGNPALLPVNMPGASGHISAAHIYNVAAKDGTVIGATTPGV